MGTDCGLYETETEIFMYESHFSNQRLGFNPGPVRVRCMVDAVAI